MRYFVIPVISTFIIDNTRILINNGLMKITLEMLKRSVNEIKNAHNPIEMPKSQLLNSLIDASVFSAI
jgi:fructose-specific phosphotransferase system IIC component